MRMTGEERIAAPRQKVWEALNDPEVLRQAIPGCQSLSQDAPDKLSAVVEVKIGPIGARFNGAVTLSDIDAPNGYTITGEGQGGMAGSAKGGAKVRLADAEVNGAAGTLLTYEVNAEVGGRLAQLGGPIIDATAKQLAGKFFKKFGEIVGGSAAAAEAATAAPVAASASPSSSSAAVPVPASAVYHAPAPVAAGGAPWAWIGAVVLALLTGSYISHMGVPWLLLVAILVIVAAAAGYEAGKRGGGR